MSPGTENPSPDGDGYSVAQLARHVTVCLTRMRRVAREMLEANSPRAAFAFATGASALVLGLEAGLRSRIAPETEGALLPEAGELANAFAAGGFIAALFVALAVAFATAWWLTARVFGAKISYAQSAIGVAAGGLPQVAISSMMIACALVMSLFVDVEQRAPILMFLDYVVILPLFGYGLVGFAAATGFSLGKTFAVQAIGAVAGAVLLFGLVAVVGLALDQSLSSLVQLVLG